jgi:hypothetical protein
MSGIIWVMMKNSSSAAASRLLAYLAVPALIWATCAVISGVISESPASVSRSCPEISATLVVVSAVLVVVVSTTAVVVVSRTVDVAVSAACSLQAVARTARIVRIVIVARRLPVVS